MSAPNNKTESSTLFQQMGVLTGLLSVLPRALDVLDARQTWRNIGHSTDGSHLRMYALKSLLRSHVRKLQEHVKSSMHHDLDTLLPLALILGQAVFLLLGPMREGERTWATLLGGDTSRISWLQVNGELSLLGISVKHGNSYITDKFSYDGVSAAEGLDNMAWAQLSTMPIAPPAHARGYMSDTESVNSDISEPVLLSHPDVAPYEPTAVAEPMPSIVDQLSPSTPEASRLSVDIPAPETPDVNEEARFQTSPTRTFQHISLATPPQPPHMKVYEDLIAYLSPVNEFEKLHAYVKSPPWACQATDHVLLEEEGMWNSPVVKRWLAAKIPELTLADNLGRDKTTHVALFVQRLLDEERSIRQHPAVERKSGGDIPTNLWLFMDSNPYSLYSPRPENDKGLKRLLKLLLQRGPDSSNPMLKRALAEGREGWERGTVSWVDLWSSLLPKRARIILDFDDEAQFNEYFDNPLPLKSDTQILCVCRWEESKKTFFKHDPVYEVMPGLPLNPAALGSRVDFHKGLWEHLNSGFDEPTFQALCRKAQGSYRMLYHLVRVCLQQRENEQTFKWALTRMCEIIDDARAVKPSRPFPDQAPPYAPLTIPTDVDSVWQPYFAAVSILGGARGLLDKDNAPKPFIYNPLTFVFPDNGQTLVDSAIWGRVTRDAFGFLSNPDNFDVLDPTGCPYWVHVLARLSMNGSPEELHTLRDVMGDYHHCLHSNNPSISKFPFFSPRMIALHNRRYRPGQNTANIRKYAVTDNMGSMYRILWNGANPCLITIDGESPLHSAIKHGSLGCLILLLVAGGRVNQVSRELKTPLDCVEGDGAEREVMRQWLSVFGGESFVQVQQRKGRRTWDKY